jgi:hypothetical protein
MNSSTARVDSTQGRPKRPNFFRLYKAINRAYPQLGGALTQALHVYLEHGDENDVTYVSPAGVARVMGHADDREAKKLKQEAVSRGWLRKVPAPAGFVRPKGMRGPPAFHHVCVPETVVQEATVSGETGVRDTTVYEETVVDQPPKRGCGGRGNSGVADSERVVFGTTRTKKNKEEQTQTKTDPACVALLIDRGSTRKSRGAWRSWRRRREGTTSLSPPSSTTRSTRPVASTTRPALSSPG